MSNEQSTTHTDPRPPLPVLYFDETGNGPDEIFLQLENVDLRIPGVSAVLGLRIHAGEIVGLIPTGGGFSLDRDVVTELHRQLGEWLEQTPTSIGRKRSDV